MLVDLHAHYPMHLQPSERQLAHERLRQWEKEWLRALIVRRLSRTFNYEGAKPSVTLEEMEQGDVGVILSPLYSPFDEIDFTRRYGSKPRPGYFTELLDQLVLVEDHIEERRNEGHSVTIAHSRAELAQALGAGEAGAHTRGRGRLSPRRRRGRSPRAREGSSPSGASSTSPSRTCSGGASRRTRRRCRSCPTGSTA